MLYIIRFKYLKVLLYSSMHYRILFSLLIELLSNRLLFSQDKVISVPGLHDKVTITIDTWGVCHIKATNEEDMFFAQGWNAARDRLFQFEVWRLQATGTAASVLGERELKRDIGARLFKFRGDMNKEMNHYHPKGSMIIKSFVKGINAYIRQVQEGEEPLPTEFKLLGIQPGFWTEEIVISRHQGLLSNVQAELRLARQIKEYGKEAVLKTNYFHPHIPDLTMDTLITKEMVNKDLLGPYNAFRVPIKWTANDINIEKLNDGSNNWVVNGSKTKSGFPILANDPHRAITVPSLRYITHLQSPGWNVIGGGEPTIPAISIGHNENGAWGLTIFETDAEDLLIYKINPTNRNEYWYKGKWTKMKLIEDTIYIKDKAPHYVVHRYTKDGPITFLDDTLHIAAAVKCGWLEIGCSPYLASLRMNQSKSWIEFKKACSYSYIPAENMIWADKNGNIGWQVVGITPIRKTHSGMVPVPGDGRYEWDGYLPVLKRPSKFNPAEGFIATANENLASVAYPYKKALGFVWADPFRGNRVREVLSESKKVTLDEMRSLQVDYLSIPARELVPYLTKMHFENPKQMEAIQLLKKWDYKLTTHSVAASIYQEWENQLEKMIIALSPIPALNNISTKLIVDYIKYPSLIFTKDSLHQRDELLKNALNTTMNILEKRLGINMSQWQYGQAKNKHAYLSHALSQEAYEPLKVLLNAGPLPRGGYENTVGSTGSGLRQSSGASFRIIVDLADWDSMIATNSPGQSGNPMSNHYKDLFPLWANDEYFPLYFSKEKIDQVKEQEIVLYKK